MGFSLLNEWRRRNDPDFWIMDHGEPIGKVVKTENKDGGFVATVKLDKDAFAAATYAISDIQATNAAFNAYQTELKGETKMIKSESQKKFEEAVAAAEQIRNEEFAAEQREKAKEEYLKAATRLHDIYEAFIEAGFAEEQAWKLLNSQNDLDIG